MSTETQLTITWSVSRGRDTYGYNICRLDDTSTGKRYKCMGGGYDMVGTVFGEWLQDAHQDRLRAISDRAYYSNGYDVNSDGLYGMRRRDDGSVSLDGWCGIESMLTIAKVIGLHVTRLRNRKGTTTGYLVTEDESR